MRKILFFLPVLFLVIIACNDKGTGGNPLDNTNNNRDKDNKNRDNDDYPEDDMSSSKGGIVGKWRLVEYKYEDDITQEAPTSLSVTLEFTRDGNFISITNYDGETTKGYGTYTYDARTKTLKTVDEDGERETVEVEFPGKNRMIIPHDEGAYVMERD